VYPAPAIKAGTKGTVELGFTILIDGSVQNVQITLSSGHEILDNAAIETIYAAAPFRPPPVELKIIIPIVYSLK
jgi:protein TonB